MGIKFGHIEIFVSEPLRSKDFYISVLGFELIEIQHDKYVWLVKNGNEILLRPDKHDFKTEACKDTNIAFVLYSNDVDKQLEEFKKKGVVIKGYDGEGCYTFTDENGNWFQLVNPDDH